MKRGFTLIELIIVVIIIGILATFAVPQYLKAVERAKQGKARHNLSILASAEKMYRADLDTYIALVDGSLNATLGEYVEVADLDADIDWTYATTAATASTLTLQADRTAGPNAAETITLDQDGIWGGDYTP